MGSTRRPLHIDCEDLWSQVYTIHSVSALCCKQNTHSAHAFASATSPRDLSPFSNASPGPARHAHDQLVASHPASARHSATCISNAFYRPYTYMSVLAGGWRRRPIHRDSASASVLADSAVNGCLSHVPSYGLHAHYLTTQRCAARRAPCSST